MQRVNGHKPNPPMEMVQPLIEFYWSIRLPDTEALKRLKSSGAFDTDLYGIEIRTYRKYRESLGFTTARKQRHTPETIREDMLDLRDKYPRAGERDMAAHLFHEKDKAVAGRTLRGYFHVYEAHLVAGRRARRLLRKRFWAAGVNDVLAVDQHDKWQRFGLRLHIGVDPFPGRIQWLKIWHTNSNPKLILSYYLEFVREQHGVPLVTQSDPGPENFLLANGHTMIRWSMDLELRFWRYIQHRWKREKKNIPPEIAWSGLRARFAPGFKDLLQLGVDQEWYDYDNLVHRYVFRWIFIPWLQAELDNYRFKVNHTRRRHDPRKIVPHGRAEDIYRFPEAYGARDFKVAVPEHVIREVEEQLIPPNLPLFQLVPPEFDQCLRYLYGHLPAELKPFGQHNVWAAYRHLLYQMETWGVQYRGDIEAFHQGEGAVVREMENIPLMPGQPLQEEVPDAPGRYAYLGGVNHGLGPQGDHPEGAGEGFEEQEMGVEEFTGYEDGWL